LGGWQKPENELTHDELMGYVNKGVTAFGWILGKRDLIVDVDPRGEESFEALQDDLVEIGGQEAKLTKTVKSPRGFHCYVRLPDGFDGGKLSSTLKKYPKIDFRRHGHYVVIAGSHVTYPAADGKEEWIGEYTHHDDNTSNGFEAQENPAEALISLLKRDGGANSASEDVTGAYDPFMNLDAKQGEDPKGRHIELVTSAFPEPTLPMIAACLYLLSDSSEYEYEPWYQAGMIIHLVDSDDKGLALFEKWSKAGRGYEEGACKDKWHSFGVEYKEKKVGIGTLVDRVRAAIAGDRTRVTHAAADMLLDEIIPRIRNSELPTYLRVELVDKIKTRLSKVGHRTTKDKVREMLEKPIVIPAPSTVPTVGISAEEDVKRKRTFAYMMDTVYVDSERSYVHIDTLETWGVHGFNADFQSVMPEKLKGKHVPVEYTRQNSLITKCDMRHWRPDMPRGLFFNNGVKILNSYQHAYVPKPDKEYTREEWIKATIRRSFRLVAGSKADADQLEQWCFHLIQRAGKQIGWCPILIGAAGVGKTELSLMLQACLGEETNGAVNAKQLNSEFNGFTTGARLVVIEEMNVSSPAEADIIKTIITAPVVKVNKKGIENYPVKNVSNYIGLTNRDNPIPITEDDRRYAVYNSPVANRDEITAYIKDELGEDIAAREHFRNYVDIRTNYVGEALKYFMEGEITDPTLKQEGTSDAPPTAGAIAISRPQGSTISHEDSIRKLLSERGEYYNEDVIVPARLRDALINDLKRRGIKDGIRIATVRSVLENMEYKLIRKDITIKGKSGSVWAKEGYSDKEIRTLFENDDFGDPF
jgi:hypothetical protein